MTRTALRSMLVAGVIAVLMAGCGTPQAGSAATVGDRRISVQDVQSATTDIQQLYGPEQPVPQRAVLFLLAAAPYLESIATKAQAGASVDDARRIFGTKVANPSDSALTVIRANAILGNLDSLGADRTTQALTEVTQSLVRDKLTVNPRYGTFDPRQGSLLPEQPNWLPTPTPTPTPSPTQ